jgi:hypothetical protein
MDAEEAPGMPICASGLQAGAGCPERLFRPGPAQLGGPEVGRGGGSSRPRMVEGVERAVESFSSPSLRGGGMPLQNG